MDWFSWLSKTNIEPSLIYQYGHIFTRNELQLNDIKHFNHEFLHSMGVSVAKHRLQILKLARKNITINGGGRGAIAHSISPFNHFGLVFLAFNKTKRCIRNCITKWGFQVDELKVKTTSRRKQVVVGPRHVSQEHSKVRVPFSEPLDEYSNYSRYRSRGSCKVGSPFSGPRMMMKERGVLSKSPIYFSSGPLEMVKSPKGFLGPLDEYSNYNRSRSRGSCKVGSPFSGHLEKRMMMKERGVLSKSPRYFSSGPLEMVKSPKGFLGPVDARAAIPITSVCSQCHRETVGFVDDDDVVVDHHLVWTSLFQDMKPT